MSERTHETTHHVQPGDTLSQIALTYLGDALRHREIARANRIKDPDLISTGATLRITGVTDARMRRLRPAAFMDDSDLTTELTQ